MLRWYEYIVLFVLFVGIVLLIRVVAGDGLPTW